MPSFFSELKRRNVIRVAGLYAVSAWLLLQVADVLFGLLVVPEGSLRLVLGILLLGFPVALVFAWAYELTPEGLKLDRDVQPGESIAAATGRKLNTITLIVAGLAIAVVVLDRLIPERQTEPVDAPAAAVQPPPASIDEPTDQPTDVLAAPDDGRKSIAVLPFTNMSGDPETVYFSDGIAEEVINLLVKVEGLRVASRTSAFSLRDEDLGIPQIAERLQVDHVLEGSVRRSGDRVRITAQLIEAETDTHLWSETYDRKLEDIFAVQDDIGQHIVGALKVQLADDTPLEVSGKTEDLQAYEMYLKGRHLWHKRGEENIRAAIGSFEQVVERDPRFARGWAALASAWITLPSYASVRHGEAVHRAASAAEKALALDANLAEPMAVMAAVSIEEGDLLESERLHRRGVDAEPGNATARMWYGGFLYDYGYLDDARRQLLSAAQIDPLYGPVLTYLSGLKTIAGEFEQAERLGQMALDRGMGTARGPLAGVAFARGDRERLLTLMQDAFREFGFDVSLAAPVVAGYFDEWARPQALEALAEMRRSQPQNPHCWMMLDYSALGATAQAFDLARQCLTEPASFPWVLLWTPQMASCRADPQFSDLLRDSPAWQFWKLRGAPDLCEFDGDKLNCR